MRALYPLAYEGRKGEQNPPVPLVLEQPHVHGARLPAGAGHRASLRAPDLTTDGITTLVGFRFGNMPSMGGTAIDWPLHAPIRFHRVGWAQRRGTLGKDGTFAGTSLQEIL